MCFFDQHRFVCGDWKWGHFRQHCAKEYRIGETCGMKLIMQTVPVGHKCKLCEKIDTKMYRRAAEVERINRWKREGQKFGASIAKSMEMIRGLDDEMYELGCERNRRLQGIGTQMDGVYKDSDVNSGDDPENTPTIQDGAEARLISKDDILLGLPITINCFRNPATVMASPDTGAYVNVISLEMVRKLGLKLLPTDGVAFRLINGKTTPCCGLVRSWCRFGKTYDVEPGGWRCTFYVMQKLASPIIMSHKFLWESKTFSKYRDRLVRLSLSIPRIPRIRALGNTQTRLACSLDGQDVEAFPDSGSEIDIISYAYAKQRGLAIRPDEGWAMFADMTVKRTVGVCTLQLTLGYGAKRLEAMSNDGRNLNLLLDRLGITNEHSHKLGSPDLPRLSSKELDASGSEIFYRDIIESTFHVLDDINVDVLIGSASVETLKVYSQNTKYLITNSTQDADSEEVPLNRIIYLSALEQKLRDISQSWLMRACKRKRITNQVPFEQTLLVADQEENARREAKKHLIAALDTTEKSDAEEAEARRQNEYEEYKIMLIEASKVRQ